MKITSVDEVLFYGGMALFVVSVFLLLIFIIFFLIKKKNLESRMEEEYGPRLSRDGHPERKAGKRRVNGS